MQPILFRFDSIVVYSYSFMMSLAFLAGSILFIILARKEDISTVKLFGLVLMTQLSALFGSRLLFLVNNYQQYESNLLHVFAPVPGGFALNGGLLFGLAAAFIFMRINKISFEKIAQSIVPAIAVTFVLLKIGCFLGGCCFGSTTAFFAGIQYPVNSLAAQAFGFNHNLHAVPLYEAGSVILIFLILFYFFKNNKFIGQSLLLFAIYFCMARIITDFFRGDVIHDFFGYFSQTQVLCTVILINLVGVYFYKVKQKILLPSQTQSIY